MEPDLWNTLRQTQLYLDSTNQPLEISQDEVHRFYQPLATYILTRGRASMRSLIAVAGPPGSGKSAFAATLAAVINAISDMEMAVAVGLDGWHYPNAHLDTHSLRRGLDLLPMRDYKGAPETFNTTAIESWFSVARRAGRAPFPIYSRQTHDPMPGAGAVESWQRIVILEGNYWLLDVLPWSQFQILFDARIFLTAPTEQLVEGLRQRHLRGGKTREETERRLREVDLPDIELVMGHSNPAEVTVHKLDSRRIASIDLPQM